MLHQSCITVLHYKLLQCYITEQYSVTLQTITAELLYSGTYITEHYCVTLQTITVLHYRAIQRYITDYYSIILQTIRILHFSVASELHYSVTLQTITVLHYRAIQCYITDYYSVITDYYTTTYQCCISVELQCCSTVPTSSTQWICINLAARSSDIGTDHWQGKGGIHGLY